jgi:coenzyme F420-reducing hydrogenase beta subunit
MVNVITLNRTVLMEGIDKQACCGCGACAQKCPTGCIIMQEDTEGFLYPEIDKKSCVGCKVCEEVCPSVHPKEPRTPLRVYAAKNKDEAVRLESSSGGIFTVLAEKIIDRKGVVFGARFNEDWEVIHSYVETKEKLSVFRGSKYVQSRIGESYKQAEEFLKAGRFVLFSGTPCQIAGLKLFLKKEYENLVTVDLICHGVPSPGVWRKYLDEFIEYQYNIKNVGGGILYRRKILSRIFISATKRVAGKSSVLRFGLFTWGKR